MLSVNRLIRAACCALAVTVLANGSVVSANSYSSPTPAQLKVTTLKWVNAQEQASPKAHAQAQELWKKVDSSASARELFDKVVKTFTLVDPVAKKFVADCRLVGGGFVAPKMMPLKERQPFFAQNMQLFYGHHLAERKMYDEAVVVLNSVDAKAVVDPATCLFYKSVCHHQLSQKKEGLTALTDLLKKTAKVPASYRTVANLMQHDLQAFKEDSSLESIARKMKDVERRLKLARGGEKVQEVEGDIIAALDELIAKQKS